MLTESQFREIADSLQDIVNELKKFNKPVVYELKQSLDHTTWPELTEYEKEFYSGPSIS